MVTAKEAQAYQQISAWNSSNLDDMALLQYEQDGSLPYLPPSTLTSSIACPRQYTSDLINHLNTSQQDAGGGVLKPSPPYCNISSPNENLYAENGQCAFPHGFDILGKMITASCTPQKQFLIFDQSGSHTRLFFSTSFCPETPKLVSRIPVNADGMSEAAADPIDQKLLMKPVFEENWDEDHLTDGDGEMREDTEEINALLYSDSDDYDDDIGENDEVSSTGHSPFIIEEDHNKDKLLEEVVEEVASSDELHKRRRLLDGRHKKSSLASAKSPGIQPVSHCYEDDVESSCAGDSNSHTDTRMVQREKKIKIRQALKALANIIPGLHSEDPLSIIDQAIMRLKSMKTDAEDLELGAHLPNCLSIEDAAARVESLGAVGQSKKPLSGFL